MAKIAFIGLGNMGGPMAGNLVKAGHEVCVFDLVPESVAKLEKLGARAADSAAQACEGVEFVVSMLPAGKHVASVYLGDGENRGLLAALDSNVVVIDSSTIDSATAIRVANVAEERGIRMMDAPVSGGVAGAEAGTLAFMCGGAVETFATTRPILEAMGKNIFHAGGHGAGQVAKMCNNMLLSVLMVGTAEALNMGADHGLDPKVLSEIMLQSSGRNWVLEVYNPCKGVMENAPASRDYQGGFMSQLMLKDLGLAMDASTVSGSSVPMGSLARSLYAMHCGQGNAQLDFSSIMKQFAD